MIRIQKSAKEICSTGRVFISRTHTNNWIKLIHVQMMTVNLFTNHYDEEVAMTVELNECNAITTRNKNIKLLNMIKHWWGSIEVVMSCDATMVRGSYSFTWFLYPSLFLYTSTWVSQLNLTRTVSLNEIEWSNAYKYKPKWN